MAYHKQGMIDFKIPVSITSESIENQNLLHIIIGYKKITYSLDKYIDDVNEFYPNCLIFKYSITGEQLDLTPYFKWCEDKFTNLNIKYSIVQ